MNSQAFRNDESELPAGSYRPQDLEVFRWKELAVNSWIVVEARRWVESMTPERDREDGPDFWRWIEQNQADGASDSLFDTFFFVERKTETIVATGSVVPDDRGIGKKNGIEGPWIGGVNVKAEYRGRNLGHILMSVLHAHLQKTATQTDSEIKVNLITSPELARSFYGSDYEIVRLIDTTEFGKVAWCRRILRPEGPSEAEIS